MWSTLMMFAGLMVAMEVVDREPTWLRRWAGGPLKWFWRRCPCEACAARRRCHS